MQTEPNEYPNQNIVYNKKRNCPICTSQSHLAEDCRSALKFLRYPISLSEIKSHAKSYEDSLIKYPYGHNVTGYSLISHPCERVLFKYSSEIKPNSCYGRFLKAVRLEHLRTWTDKRKPKRKSNQQMEDEPKNKSRKKNLVLNPFAQKMRLASEKHSTKKVDKEQNESNVVNVNEPAENTEEKEKNTSDILSQSLSAQIIGSAETENIQENETENIQGNETVNSFKNLEEIVQTSTPIEKKIKSRQLGALPDFIPLNYSDDDDDYSDNHETENDNINSEAEVKADDNDPAVSIDDNETCQGRIYLTKFHSKYLLSPEGNQYLIENSTKFDVTCQIKWVSVGNMLIIHGLPCNQDRFHQELMEKFRILSDQSNRRELEKSQNLPKRRDALIRFLNESILQLNKNLGNVIDLFKRLEELQFGQTKTSWKMCEKARKTLNMILMGQAGLRKGRENLEALLDNIKHLKESKTIDIVPDSERAKISEHWRYIFSSQQHENYKDLIQQYKELRKKNELPKLNLNLRMAGNEVIDISLTDEQKQQKLNKIKTELIPALPQKSDDRKKDEYEGKNDIQINLSQPQYHQHQQQQQQYQHQQHHQQQQQQQQHFNNKQIFKKPRPWQDRKGRRHSNNTNTGSFVSRSITEVNRDWRNRCNDLINQLDKKPPQSRKNIQNQMLTPSIFWSRECMRFIDECLAMNPSNSAVREKLLTVQDKARRGLLSHNNYQSLMKIFNVLKGRN